MGEARTPLFAYVDESGNTGRNIFDTAQPDYYTAALVSRGDFDRNYGDQVRAIAGKVGATAIHANELGLGAWAVKVPLWKPAMKRVVSLYLPTRLVRRSLSVHGQMSSQIVPDLDGSRLARKVKTYNLSLVSRRGVKRRNATAILGFGPRSASARPDPRCRISADRTRSQAAGRGLSLPTFWFRGGQDYGYRNDRDSSGGGRLPSRTPRAGL